MEGLDPRFSLVVAGHVDHGKSTLVGRLLADTGSVPASRVEAVREHCARAGRAFEHAFLLDALKEERERGITLDVARAFFRTERRSYVVADAPGHLDLVRNMVTGAARAEGALLVVDAVEGLRESTRRHAQLLALLGVTQVAVLLNKIDLPGFDRRRFEEVAGECRELLRGLGLAATAFIPVSGKTGDNIAGPSKRTPWFEGPTVVGAIDGFASRPAPSGRPFRMPVQDVYKLDHRRIVAGTVEWGAVRAGDQLVFLPSGGRARVKTIEAFGAPRSEAGAGEAAGFTLEEEIHVPRGEIAARVGEEPPRIARRLRVSLFWLGKTPLLAGKDVLLKLGTARAQARLEKVLRVLDGEGERDRLGENQLGECVLRLDGPLAFDPGAEGATGRFVLVDDYRVEGGGTVLEALPEAASLLGPAVVWLTGLSGAGKTTLATALARELSRRGVKVEVLDGDEIRAVFPSTGFGRAERDAHVKRVGFAASLLEKHGVTVIAALVSPYAEARGFARGLCRRFLEVHLATPLAECERRDVKGLYARARRGELESFTGISDPYEPPPEAELTLDTTGKTVEECLGRLLSLLEGRLEGRL